MNGRSRLAAAAVVVLAIVVVRAIVPARIDCRARFHENVATAVETSASTPSQANACGAC